jgi:hypothetical protein
VPFAIDMKNNHEQKTEMKLQHCRRKKAELFVREVN